MNAFDAKLQETGQWPLLASSIDTLQANLGRRCNQACRHCHVEAGPARTESMSRHRVDTVLEVLRNNPIGRLDLTGGAPELHPDFEHLVSEARSIGREVIDRSNLTVLLEPGREHLIEFLRDHEVSITASLPYFLAENVDRQRGPGVFAKSLEALHRLNNAGYGLEDTGLQLNLVYNPLGAYLPGSQMALEAQFRDELRHRYNVCFSRLYTITNMPIGRFADYLRQSGNEQRYWQRLRASFNPAVVPTLMCQKMVSIGWDGYLYDCDFNQMLDMKLDHGLPDRVERFNYATMSVRKISTADHCFGCTAGAGSSCGGALA